MIVTAFKHYKDTKQPYYADAAKVLHKFANEDKHNIGTMLHLSNEEYKKAKNNLPIICFGGKFKTRASKQLIESSGLLTLDFDNIPLQEVRTSLKAFPSTYAVFNSPSGKGIKALIKIPKVKNDFEYKQYYSQLERLFPLVDISGKDISRACFICYDPNMYVNPDAITFEIDEVEEEKPKKKPTKINAETNDYKALSRVCEIIRHAQKGERHDKILKASRLAGGFIASGLITYDEAERILLQEADNINEDWKDNQNTVRDGLEHGMNDPITDKNQLYQKLEGEENLIKFGKIYYTANDLNSEIENLYLYGNQKGYTTGHKELDEHYTVKEGSTTYVYGAPYSGKTQFWFEILLCLSIKHGLRHAIFSPETGSAPEIFAELIQMHAQQDFYKTYNKQMNLEIMEQSKRFVNEHFIVIDPKNNIIGYKDFFNYVNEVERVYNTKIHTATIDPFNEFKQDLKEFQGRQDLYLEAVLTEVRENARINNRHNCIITHVQGQQLQKQDNTMFYPMPTYREIAGGQAWSRKGMSMISIWRPKEGLRDEYGIPYESNATLVGIQKSKPKGVGKTGNIKMLLDLNKHRYLSDDGNEPNLKKGEQVETKYSIRHEEKTSKYEGYDDECGF